MISSTNYVTALNSGGESSGSNIVSTWGDTFHEWFIETETRPESFALLPNYPKPFNPQTELRYALASAGYVELVITNLLGQPVRTLVAESQPADWHRIVWDGRNDQGKLVASGIYLYHITVQTNNDGEIFTKVRKMSLIR